ncbi:hypothetical protein CCR97_22450 [Rhodoplanes elegans]|uniref:Terminase n=1 Tax=Rhodoplanes elegans TaxID=29408 RepID=A0A327JY00_9BRAD|nr:hypothetical protein [Rhodoplanes elegans]MBK5960943.1 hypothetical protein [Rhodoplanes elegans]RAI30464.1 hypothetical protein CH338_27600 [Rhodoplanes elegans]
MDIVTAIADQHLFRGFFPDRRPWAAWLTFMRCLFGLQLGPEDLRLFAQCTGRTAPLPGGHSEAWLVVGRRGGKSRILALIATWLAAFVDWRPYLAPGERGRVVIISPDRRQAKTILDYVRAFLTQTPMLRELVVRETADEVDLSTGITIQIATASYRTVRGSTVVAALLDECAFFWDEGSANPDVELLAALRPAMATVPGSVLLAASSPYARRGILYSAYRRHWARDGDPVLVWQATTRTMNPLVPQRVIDDAVERDPAAAAAEFGAQFRTDVETFVSRDDVEACVEPGVVERAPISTIRYHAFVDPSGGGADSFTMAVGHRERDTIVVDAVRERRPPFAPTQVVAEFAALLRSYRVTRVHGDRYAGDWPAEAFSRCGIRYEPAGQPKSAIYQNFLPRLRSRTVVLPDDPRLVAQVAGLERRTARGGRDSIDHAPGAHDDLANVCAGVCAGPGAGGGGYDSSMAWVR